MVMISCVNYENLQQFGKAFSSQFRLRYRCFIERQKYNVSSYNEMEYDQYDTPASAYFVYESPDGEALGCSRLTPVSQGSMLQDLWPDLVDNPDHLYTNNVWEGTRFCIDKRLPPNLRQQICRELVLAYLEFGLNNGVQKIIGVMPPLIFKRVFGRAGCEYDLLGPEKIIDDGDVIRAAALVVSAERLIRVRKKTGISQSVLNTGIVLSTNQKTKVA
ncbi:MAG: autoinducer synthesis protein [Alphaproteobacteria bacterium]|nr:autoinducer synthesis protein [Alphaproteobacteria bacterium]